MSRESFTIRGPIESGQDVADAVSMEFQRLDALKAVAIERWREVKAYQIATDTGDLPQVNSFDHTVHQPIVSTISQDLKAILLQVVLPHEDWFSFKAYDLEAVAAKESIISFLKNRHAMNGFESLVGKLRSDLVDYGNCFSTVKHVDESVGENEGYIGPKPFRISPYDIVFNPKAPDFDSTYKIIREDISVGELLRRGQNGTFPLDVVKKILAEKAHAATESTDDHKNMEYVPRGFGTYQDYLMGTNIEVLWFYGDIYVENEIELQESRMVVVANRELVLDEKIDTVDGRPLVFKSGWEDMGDNLWSMGPMENITGINYLANHRENSKNEGLDRMIYPDKVVLGDVEEVYDDETGTITYIGDESAQVSDLPINSQFLSFDLQVDRATHTARQAARLPSDLTGFRSQGEKTLGEVTALTDGGMRGFIDKAAEFERTTLVRILAAEVQLAQKHFVEVFEVPTKSKSGFLQMLDINKADLSVRGALVPQGAKRFARKNQMLSSLTQLSQTPLFELASPHMSSKGAAEIIDDLLETEDTNLFKKDAQVLEGSEQQKLMNQQEQSLALSSAQPTAGEVEIEQELEELQDE